MNGSADHLPHQAARSRIAFLGTDLNPMSVRCLRTLADEAAYDLLVGLDGGQGGAFDVVKSAWRRHGSLGLLRRVRAKLLAAIRVRLRKAGYPLGAAASLSEIAIDRRLAVFVCHDVNQTPVVRRLAEFAPRLIVVANFSQIIRPAVLAIPSRGVINLHPSLLPKYRGPMPYYWVLRNRESTSGVTIHYIDEGVDSGDIIAQAAHAVHSDDTELSLRRRSIRIGAPLLARAVRDVLAASAERTPQDNTAASYFGFPPRGASQL